MRTGLIVVTALVAVGCVPPKRTDSGQSESRFKGTLLADDWRYKPVQPGSATAFQADAAGSLGEVADDQLSVAYWDLLRVIAWATQAQRTKKYGSIYLAQSLPTGR